jgi:anti-sigma B factor antagonist
MIERIEETEPRNLEIRMNGIRDKTVVELEGEVDMFTSGNLRSALFKQIASGRKDLVICLDGLDFMDSTGLAVLIEVFKRTGHGTGDLKLVCNKDRLMKLFAITGLDTVFSIHGDIRDCL